MPLFGLSWLKAQAVLCLFCIQNFLIFVRKKFMKKRSFSNDELFNNFSNLSILKTEKNCNFCEFWINLFKIFWSNCTGHVLDPKIIKKKCTIFQFANDAKKKRQQSTWIERPSSRLSDKLPYQQKQPSLELSSD
jgi:hypothetical protein